MMSTMDEDAGMSGTCSVCGEACADPLIDAFGKTDGEDNPVCNGCSLGVAGPVEDADQPNDPHGGALDEVYA